MRSRALSKYLFAAISAFLPIAYAQGQGSAAIQKKLESEYGLTKTTDDKTDIVTAGSVLVLEKDNLLMLDATKANPCANVYINGAITQNGICRAGKRFGGLTKHVPGLGSMPDSSGSRTFVTGEKFWVTKIEVKDSGKQPGMVFSFYSDEINNTRYAASLLIPFAGPVPAPDDALKLAEVVIKVAPAEDAKQQASAQAPGQTQAASDPPPSQIAPPPPPAADPANISEGQTKQQVVAALGQPLKTSKVGTKEIYFYKDMKITFVNGKVKDVQ